MNKILEQISVKDFLDLKEMFDGKQNNATTNTSGEGLNSMIGEKVIIRTYSAGVWFGTLDQKAGNEVIISNARRMYYWKAEKSISLSGVAKYGIDQEESKICPALEQVWLEAIEILPCTTNAIESIEGAKDVEAE